MSAFMCSDNHINAILAYAYANRMTFRVNGHEHYASDAGDCAFLGNILKTANAESIVALYGKREPSKMADRKPFVFHVPPSCFRPDAVVIVKTCDCYEYQSCEADTYSGSAADYINRKVREHAACYAIRTTEDYDAAPWGIPPRKEELRESK